MAESGPGPTERERRRLAEIFGDTMPDVTSDELDEPARAGEGGGRDEEWYRTNRPPHHDRDD
ncbi:hypothetical protein GCM10009836_20640 [Pseudonocardia ailaonensis]|uniref:Uncharacterized protein n=1 Tax=Pseudonocardia ailaonensis TaxID=367279 RepID=A0ABN2MWP0_9PSEU